MGYNCIEVQIVESQYKAYINKRNGNLDLYKQSLHSIVDTYSPETKIYPGHGEPFFVE